MNKIQTAKRLWSVLTVLVFTAYASLAQEPTGPVILEVSGTPNTSTDATRFDRAMLEELGTVEIVTDTPWTEGSIVFSGVLLRDVLDIADAKSGYVRAIDLNDYAVDIPLSDVTDYDVILALQRDGKYLTVRDKGPLWVIYPWSDEPALRTQLHYSRSIWQLNKLEFEVD